MTFYDCVMACAAEPRFVEGFDRLIGANLCGRGTGLDLAIDKATGRQDAELQAFIVFCWDVVWTRLPVEVTG